MNAIIILQDKEKNELTSKINEYKELIGLQEEIQSR